MVNKKWTAVVLSAVLAACTSHQDEPRATDTVQTGSLQQGVQVGLTEVVQQNLQTRTKLGGYVEPHEVIHMTAQSGGRVVYLTGREGAHLMAGQVAVGLDEDKLMGDYRSAWSHLSSEMSSMQNAQVQLYSKMIGEKTSPMGGPMYDAYDRSAVPFYNMFQKVMPIFGGSGQMVPQSEQQNTYASHSQARTDYERQMSGIVAAQSKVDGIEGQLRDRRSIAPYPAIILAKYVNLGDVVQPGQALVDLAQTDQLNLKLEAPTRLVMQMHLGERVPVVLEKNVTVDGVVEQINPSASTTQHTVTVKIGLPPNAPAAPGMYAAALLAEPPVVGEVTITPVIPVSSLVYRGSLPSVFVLGANNKLELRVIRLGEVQGDRVSVLSGVNAGDKVVTQPTQTTRSGDSAYEKTH
jgi:RND family efflux transporter MFP subunit